jgi:4-amino-4-deoxy-L-arabinose transferase-like glycosyltransferase
VFAAVTSFLVLLSSPWFYFFAIEARLDSGVIAAILAALLVAIKGWRDERYLIALFPLMAVGFLIKSIIILLVVPLVLIYSVAYREWRWLQNRYLWLGSLIAAGLWLPWHFLETWRFGSQFWQSYLISNLARTTSQVTGTNNIGDYVIPLMIKMPVWFWLCLTLMVGFLIISSFSRGKDHLIHRQIAAPLASALFIFAVFTAAHTHLAAYVLPAYPFLAMFVALFAYTAVPLGKKVLVIPLLALFLIISGAYYCLSIPWTSFQDEARFAKDEMLIGKYYHANHSAIPEALYSLQWDGLDAINFYSGTKIIYTTARSAQLTEMTPPFFLVATTEYLNMLYKQVPQQFNQFKIVYVGTYLVMLYSQQPFSVGGPSK